MATERNNLLFFINNCGYEIISGSFYITESKITKSQENAHHISPGTTIYYKVQDTDSEKRKGFNFQAGRKGSEDVAKWFNNEIGINPEKNTTFGHTAGSLNFACKGKLKLTLKKDNKEKLYEFSDIVLAQGHSAAANNWWFGGENCNYKGGKDVTVLSDDRSIILTCQRGDGDIASNQVYISNVYVIPRNIVNLSLENLNDYIIESASYKVTGYCVSDNKITDVTDNKIYNIKPNGNTISFDFGFEQEATVKTSKWFTDRIASNENTFKKNPDKLNFAVIGDLTIVLKGKSHPNRIYNFKDVAFAQGSSFTANNWWFGGKKAESISGYQVMLPSIDEGKEAKVIFLRGSDTNFLNVNTVSMYIPTRNVVELNISSSKYGLKKAIYKVKDFSVSDGQSYDIQRDFVVKQENSSLSFDFGFDRKKTSKTAELFQKVIKSSENIFNENPDELNFFVVGDLIVELLGQGLPNSEYSFTFKDVVFAQGSSGTANNWWLGIKGSTYQASAYFPNRSIKLTHTLNGDVSTSFEFYRPTLSTSFNTLTMLVPDFPENYWPTNTGWMKRISDNKLLHELSIPGTHDTGTYAVYVNVFAQTQTLSILEQLQAGIRYLDIRCHHADNRLSIYHGPIPTTLTFQEVIKDCITFLNANPSECIIMQVKNENDLPEWGNNRSFYETFISNASENPNYWYLKDEMPTLGSVRKKIVLIRRFDSDKICGLNYQDTNKFCIQDEFLLQINEKPEKKSEKVINFIKSLENRDVNKPRWYINYTSATYAEPSLTLPIAALFKLTPWYIAQEVNTALNIYLYGNKTKFLGTVIMDYPEYHDLRFSVNKIIESNFNN